MQPNILTDALEEVRARLRSARSVFVLTGAGSRRVLELHGNIWRARCTRCDTRSDLRANDEGARPPACRVCGAPMRPDVVLFGELLPAGVFERAAAAAAECDLCFVVGTSA